MAERQAELRAAASGLVSASSCASTALSSHHDSGVQQKIKLRLCYGGRFEQVGGWRTQLKGQQAAAGRPGPRGRLPAAGRAQVARMCRWCAAAGAGATAGDTAKVCHASAVRLLQTANNSYKFVGGEYFNESIPYGIRYADFMFKLSEKFRTAVSVKYHAPGEELVPDQLISVQDDADLQVCAQCARQLGWEGEAALQWPLLAPGSSSSRKHTRVVSVTNRSQGVAWVAAARPASHHRIPNQHKQTLCMLACVIPTVGAH